MNLWIDRYIFPHSMLPSAVHIGSAMVHYLQAGMEKTGGSKTKTAELLGLPNYQTLTNWLKKHGLD